jgi:DNA-binding IclR family transcriptional regulator
MHQQRNPARPSEARSPEPVRSYAAMNTVRALECLAFTPLSAPQLADSLQVSVRTARRLLKRLAIEGFVIQERDHRRRYHSTMRLAALGRQMLDHAPVVSAAAPHLAQLANDTSCAAHLWIAGYLEQVICAVHAQAAGPTVSLLHHTAPATTNAAGTVLLKDRAHLRSCCYLNQTGEPTLAAAVLEHGQVIAALGVTGDKALDATRPVITAAARLSMDLGSRR